ncbi:MAG: hypothetical protein JW748_14925 [Anaerolineales bacterium]|nr:hypothetical protein [Anaerolineales bacterium]
MPKRIRREKIRRWEKTEREETNGAPGLPPDDAGGTDRLCPHGMTATAGKPKRSGYHAHPAFKASIPGGSEINYTGIENFHFQYLSPDRKKTINNRIPRFPGEWMRLSLLLPSQCKPAVKSTQTGC